MLYRTPLRMLSDLVSPKALERILDSSARSRGKALADLNHDDIADILKRDIFKRLQLSVPAPLAKKRIQEVLEAIEQNITKNTVIRNEDALLAGLESSAKRFSLYFEWPEAQKLRALIGVARAEMDEGKSVPGLLDEGMALVAALERRLNEGLVQQANDLAELKAELTRFTGVGGPKLRRLEGLIAQIEDAQRQDTLSPAEVDRARHLALDLRKLVESSVISVDGGGGAGIPHELPDTALLPLEAQKRLRELDRESEARDLDDLLRDYAVLLRTRTDLAQHLETMRARSAAGEVLGPQLAGLRETFNQEQGTVLKEQREQLSVLSARIETLGDRLTGSARDDARLALEVARGTLGGNVLATDELARLEGTVRTLEGQAHASAERTAQVLAQQNELYELEGMARGTRGAEAELAPHIAQARTALERGELVALDDLWSTLERRMGQLAQEREDYDARARFVVEEYDRYRHLAGETIQKLGRLVDNLRRVQELGTLSIEARTKYQETLQEAEALLGEARAEFEAARELTSTFGADALAGLLDVFGSGDDGLFGALDTAASTTPELNSAPTTPDVSFATVQPGVPAGSLPEEDFEDFFLDLDEDESAELPATLASGEGNPLATTLEALVAQGGVQLAIVQGNAFSWGSLDSVNPQVIWHLADASALLGGARIVTMELADGALLALPVAEGMVVARVTDASSVLRWRERLLDVRASFA